MECSSKEMTGVEDIFDTAVTTAVGVEVERAAAFRGEEVQEESGRGSGMSSGKRSKKSKSRKCNIL